MDTIRDRLQAFMNDVDAPNPPGFGHQRHSAISSRQPLDYTVLDPATRTYPSPRSRRSSSSGSKSSSLSECFDRRRDSSSSTSTAASTVSSVVPALPWGTHVLPVNRFQYTFNLPCEFGFLGCQVSFHAEHYEDWVAHSISHFGSAGPPTRSICTVCDDFEFEDEDSHMIWRVRMDHIRRHFENGISPRNTRPDFFVVDHFWNNGLMTKEDHDRVMKYTERPKCKYLVPAGYPSEFPRN